MAQVVTRTIVDDIDGSEAERTLHFAVDGTNYAIDLSTANINEFKSAIGGFLESARKVGKVSGKATRTHGASQADREQTRVIREWAKAHGHTISERGRIPATVQKAFADAH
jgi:hypothetical protein